MAATPRAPQVLALKTKPLQHLCVRRVETVYRTRAAAAAAWAPGVADPPSLCSAALHYLDVSSAPQVPQTEGDTLVTIDVAVPLRIGLSVLIVG